MTTVEVKPVAAQRSKVYNSDGQEAIKHGQKVDDDFVTAILASYTNTVNRSHILIFYIFMIFVFLSEFFNSATGPLEQVKVMFVNISSDSSLPDIERNFANKLIPLFDWLIVYKFRFIACAFAFMTYAFRPTTQNLWLGIFHVFCIFLFRQWAAIDFVILSQVHFIYASIRKPLFKLVILIIGLAAFFVSVEIGSSPTSKVKKIQPQPTNP